MNRRGFLSAMLRAGAAMAVLPAATTYARRWVRPDNQRLWVNHVWFNEPLPDYYCVMDSPTPHTTLYSHSWTVEVPIPGYAQIQYATAKELDEMFV